MQKKQGQDFSFPPLILQNILNRNDKSEHITNLDNVVRIIIVWSEWRDLNSRPLDPQSSALPTALHPDILFCCASRGQLVYINMTVMKLQPLISIFLKFFCKRDSMKTCWQSPQLYGIISKVFRRRTAFTMERCPSGWRNRSWKPATCKRPWVRIPLSPPLF